jgi:hypothetical protein
MRRPIRRWFVGFFPSRAERFSSWSWCLNRHELQEHNGKMWNSHRHIRPHCCLLTSRNCYARRHSSEASVIDRPRFCHASHRHRPLGPRCAFLDNGESLIWLWHNCRAQSGEARFELRTHVDLLMPIEKNRLSAALRSASWSSTQRTMSRVHGGASCERAPVNG